MHDEAESNEHVASLPSPARASCHLQGAPETSSGQVSLKGWQGQPWTSGGPAHWRVTWSGPPFSHHVKIPQLPMTRMLQLSEVAPFLASFFLSFLGLLVSSHFHQSSLPTPHTPQKTLTNNSLTLVRFNERSTKTPVPWRVQRGRRCTWGTRSIGERSEGFS